MNSTTINIFYPHQGGELLLRTDADWEVDIAPDHADAERGVYVFHLQSDEVFVYFKPILKINGETHFARGFNALALMEADEQDHFPYFFTSSAGRVSDMFHLDSTDEDERSHSVRVYVPPGYEENTMCRYPVLYMHDGNNLFFPEEAFTGQTWEVDRAISLLDSMSVIDPVIVVAVYPKDRMHDYTNPGYQSYGRFIVETLKPVIDDKYRTLPDAENTATMGSSLGGVVSMFLGWEYPKVFGKIACLSSTFTWKDDLWTRIKEEARRDIRIYLDSGWPGDNFEVNRGMFDLLQRQGYDVNSDVLYLAFPEAEHSEMDWATRLHIPFQFLFARYAQQVMRRAKMRKPALV